MSVAPRHPKKAGDAIAADVVQSIDVLENVPDSVAEWHDARVNGVLDASERVRLGSVVLLEDGTPVEIKSAQKRLNSGQRGRFYIRRKQHETLVQEAAAYLFAVYDPRTTRILGMIAVPASVVDVLLPPSWTPVSGDRAETGYNQLGWSRLLEPAQVEGVDQ